MTGRDPAGGAAAVSRAPRRPFGPVTRDIAGVPVGAWLVGLLSSLVVAGPALGGGSLLNLDLVLVPRSPLPAGMWGLGPELPRRVPLWGPLTWLSSLVDSTVVGKALMVAAMTLAFCGAWRLVGRNGLAPWAAALIYAFSPFLATRIAVGHWLVMWTAALLPWAVPVLLAPLRSRSSTVLWCAALGLGGVFGGLVAGAYLLAGLVREHRELRRRRRASAGFLLAALATQLVWMVPLLIVGSGGSGVSLASASDFAPPLDGFGDLGRLLAGQGFWSSAFEIGHDQPVLFATAGFVLLALAIVGVSEVPVRLRVPMTVLAAVSFALGTSSAIPVLDGLVDALTGTAVGAPFRDTQRFFLPYVLWLGMCAGFGGLRLGRRGRAGGWRGALAGVAMATPLALALLLAVPSVWGFGGELRPVRFPDEWAAARDAVVADPGPVVSLPWFQYFSLDLARNRLTLGVVPYYFGGDVITASDPRISEGTHQEVADPREPVVAAILERAQRGEHVASDLAGAGVRWIALQHDVDWRSYTGIVDDPGLSLAVSGPSLDLYRVDAWQGPVVADGVEVPSSAVVAPVLRVDPSGAAVLERAYQRGWLRGWSTSGSTPEGLVALAAGSGLVWYWPAVLVLVTDALWLVTVGAAVVLVSRRSRSEAEKTPYVS